MPKPALKPCAQPGCTELVRAGYCVKHAPKDRAYHDPKVQRLYKTKRWLQIRIMQLAKEPWCAACLRANTYTPAIDVDHIEPHRGDPKKFYAGPFQSLCHSHHSQKTANEVNGRGVKKFRGGGDGARVASDFSMYGFGVLKRED